MKKCIDCGEQMVKNFYLSSSSNFYPSCFYWQCPACGCLDDEEEEEIVDSMEVIAQKKKNRNDLLKSFANSSDPYLQWLAEG